jgi:hypothetical protein
VERRLGRLSETLNVYAAQVNSVARFGCVAVNSMPRPSTFERIHRFAPTDERENREARPLLRAYTEQLNSLEQEIT